MKIQVKWLVGLLLICSTAGGAFAAEKKTEVQVKAGKIFLNLKDAEIKSVLQTFAKATGTNIIAADDVSGKITLSFTGISPRKGLEAVLRTKGLDWFEEEGTIYVSTKKIMRSYYLESARPSDIAALVKDILPAGSTVSMDVSYNVLVVQTSSDYLPRLEKLIHDLDVPPVQVMIEVRMIELKRSNGGNIGTNIKYTNPKDVNDVAETKNLAGRSTDTSAQGIYAHVISGDIDAYLSALKTAAIVNTIATPRLTTLSNKTATILIGQKLGYKTLNITQLQTTQQINFISVGTQLTITPQVTKNGFIRMAVAPKISDGEVINDVPNENTTETKNEVMVKDGQTFVIGGLIKDKDTQTDYGVPFIMDIPFIGAIFRKTVITKEKQELLVFVTPHILTAEKLEELSKQGIKEMEEKAAREKGSLIH